MNLLRTRNRRFRRRPLPRPRMHKAEYRVWGRARLRLQRRPPKTPSARRSGNTPSTDLGEWWVNRAHGNLEKQHVPRIVRRPRPASPLGLGRPLRARGGHRRLGVYRLRQRGVEGLRRGQRGRPGQDLRGVDYLGACDSAGGGDLEGGAEFAAGGGGGAAGRRAPLSFSNL